MSGEVNFSEGVLLVDKPEGPTSHDVVRMARRALATRRIGHTGTLDPFASGLLLLCVGRATRLAEYLSGLNKCYRGVARLGVSTTTADLTGEELQRSERWRTLREEEIMAAFQAQVGEIDQLPPVFSAKKVGGVRAYDLARRGEEVELRPVRVVIERIEIVELDLPDVTFEVECSSGTYVRSIARDVGDSLGVGGHLRALRRTRIGSHKVEDAVPAEKMDDPELVRRAWRSPLAAISHLPRLEVGEAEARRIRHGMPIPAGDRLAGGREANGLEGGGRWTDATPLALVRGGELLAIGAVEGGSIRARKVFAGD